MGYYKQAALEQMEQDEEELKECTVCGDEFDVSATDAADSSEDYVCDLCLIAQAVAKTGEK
jgi:hypothetical protein